MSKQDMIDDQELGIDFYRNFYNENRVALLQYENLRENFSKMTDDVLGKDYYNMGMDVYDCDRICCEDITYRAKGFWKKLFELMMGVHYKGE